MARRNLKCRAEYWEPCFSRKVIRLGELLLVKTQLRSRQLWKISPQQLLPLPVPHSGLGVPATVLVTI